MHCIAKLKITLFFLPSLDTIAPELNNTQYVLDINSVKHEIIPGKLPMYVVDKKKPLEFELINVKWNGKISNKFLSNTTNPPKGCTYTNNVNESPHNFFCINKSTGKIYTTNHIETSEDSVYLLTVQITDRGSFPIRKTTAILTLKTKDECSATSKRYNQLSKCVDYKDTRNPKLLPNYLLFDLDFNFQSIIGVTVRPSELNVQKNVNKLHVKVELKSEGSVIKSVKTTFQLNFTSAVFTIPFVLFGAVKNNQIFVSFYEVSSATLLSLNQQVAVTSSLKYISTFQCNKSCLKDYSHWKAEASNITTQFGYNCSQDPQLYYRSISVCKSKYV